MTLEQRFVRGQDIRVLRLQTVERGDVERGSDVPDRLRGRDAVVDRAPDAVRPDGRNEHPGGRAARRHRPRRDDLDRRRRRRRGRRRRRRRRAACEHCHAPGDRQ
ncbi:hypothetical protein ETX26_08795 [Pelagerythrobacter rhizovicinus]|uniref:Uncharacterized protein n=1 Tax=Pelagerythrobacter rhizovicinus TaxID=2268576 RepID=A0A4Q2KG69_9SPHN|nr:hypothetical protein ETX26_08795 [Pelagerythrobacter rhizovicinus]